MARHLAGPALKEATHLDTDPAFIPTGQAVVMGALWRIV